MTIVLMSTTLVSNGRVCRSSPGGLVRTARIALLLGCLAALMGGCEPSVDKCAYVTCTALGQCHAVGVCDPDTGTCSHPVNAEGTVCDDGNVCTQTDTCQSGICTGTPVVCPPAPDLCHEAGCDPNTGCYISAKTCPESYCHYAGVCDLATGTCSNPKPDGTLCYVSLDSCPMHTCQAGVCVVKALPPDGDVTPPSIPTSLTKRECPCCYDGIYPLYCWHTTCLSLDWMASSDDESGVASYVVYQNGVARAVLSGRTGGWGEATPRGFPLTDTYTVSARDCAGNESASSGPAVVVTCP